MHSQISKCGSWANLSTIHGLKGDTEGEDSSSLSAKAPIATKNIKVANEYRLRNCSNFNLQSLTDPSILKQSG